MARTPDMGAGLVAAPGVMPGVVVSTGMAAVVRMPVKAACFVVVEAITGGATGGVRRVGASLLGWNLLCGGWSGSWLNVTR
ncbi:hypothetical protein ACQPZF_00355 [Actinosynnema sp. CS-041913]|uniref:hypothetical protein n=1 Tax=Actinosynnema sp. CS-041913 TaxID=3239917 RepID=UPI003D8A85ED